LYSAQCSGFRSRGPGSTRPVGHCCTGFGSTLPGRHPDSRNWSRRRWLSPETSLILKRRRKACRVLVTSSAAAPVQKDHSHGGSGPRPPGRLSTCNRMRCPRQRAAQRRGLPIQRGSVSDASARATVRPGLAHPGPHPPASQTERNATLRSTARFPLDRNGAAAARPLSRRHAGHADNTGTQESQRSGGRPKPAALAPARVR
jgi:hypothetical protein